MNKPVLSPVRQPFTQGRRAIAGLWLPHDWYDEDARCRIVWRYWHKNARLMRFSDGDLLRFAAAEMAFCHDLPGWPLILYGTTMSAADLTDDEQKKLPQADCWIIRGENVGALHFSNALGIDPADWLDISGYQWLEAFDMKLPPPIIEMATPVSDEDIRMVLGDKIAKPDKKQQSILKKLKAKAAAQKAKTQKSTGNASSEGRGTTVGKLFKVVATFFAIAVMSYIISYLQTLKSPFTLGAPAEKHTTMVTGSDWNAFLLPLALLCLALIVLLLYLLFTSKAIRGMMGSALHDGESGQYPSVSERKRAVHQWGTEKDIHSKMAGDDVGNDLAASAGQEGDRAPLASNASQKPSPHNGGIKQRDEARPKRPAMWRRLVAHFATMTRMSRMIGLKQARYLDNMMKMFAAGDFDQALRHALPLSSGGDDAEPAFGVPRPRDHLHLTGGRRAGAGIGLDEQSAQMIRNLYRHAFEELARQGKIEEATFILAELLGERGEALDFLEKNGHLEQAAKLALAWDMASDIIVRLYCLMGAWDYAIAVARRDHAFDVAVLRLEVDNPAAAARLREEWACHTAEQGRLMAAIDIIWPLETKRSLALQWLIEAENAGGEFGAVALVKRAILLPDTVEAYKDKIDQMMEAQNPKPFARLIAEIGIAFARGEVSDGLFRLARFTSRPALIRHQTGMLDLERKKFEKFLAASGQKALITDLPQTGWVDGIPDAFSTTHCCSFDAPNEGLPRDIFDIISISNGRYLLALGDGGVLMVDALGRKQAFFDIPASHFVVSASRSVVLLLMRRESLWRIARLDLNDSFIHELGSLPLLQFARDFDGVTWSVAFEDGFVHLLDTARGLQSLWKSGQLPGPVLGIRHCHYFIAGEIITEQYEQWLIGNDYGKTEIWQYELPSRTLREREICPELPEGERLYADPWSFAYRYSVSDDENGMAIFHYSNALDADAQSTYVSLNIPYDDENQASAFFVLQDVCVIGYGVRAYIVPTGGSQIIATLDWGDERFMAAEQQNHLIVYDDRGRFFHFDMVSKIGLAITLQ